MRPLYVLIPPSPLFAAHWSFFLPDEPDDKSKARPMESTTGRRIHVSGDRLNGFGLEIVRVYDVSKHRAVGSRRFAIALVPAQVLGQATESEQSKSTTNHELKDDDEGGGYVDNSPIDAFERVCVEVEAPGPSLNKVAPREPGKGQKREAKDCQWWIREVVKTMVERGMLSFVPPDKGRDVQDPVALVAKLPVH